MRHQWVVYAIVAALGLGVGLAIAGIPSSESVDPTIVVAAESPAAVPESTVVEVTTTETAAETTVAPTTTLAPSTTAAPETTTTVAPEPVLPERSALSVVVANGANIGGLASRTSSDLEDLGYVNVVATDGTDIVLGTTVYFAVGLEGSAARLAVDLGLDPTAIAPIENAPEITGDFPGAQLLGYLGADLG